MVKRQTKGGPTQRQTQIVNINMGKLKKRAAKKGAAKKGRPGTKSSSGALLHAKSSSGALLHAFNPPPIVNFPPGFAGPNGSLVGFANGSQPNAWATPQRQYAVFAEGETAGPLGVNKTKPVPFNFVAAERVLKPVPKTPALTSLPIFGAPEPSLGGLESVFAEDMLAAVDSSEFEAERAAEELKAARRATRRQKAAEKREADRRTSADATAMATAEPKSEITFLGDVPEEKAKGLERERKATPSALPEENLFV